VIADRIDCDFHLTKNQIQKMIDDGMEIGSHGLTHKYLPLLKQKEIEHELKASANILESIIHRPVEYFAFPGGHYNRNILKLTEKSGYKSACSCLQGLNTFKTFPYLLKRIEVRNKFVAEEFNQTFKPANIAFYQFVDLWKNLLRQAVGLDTYTRIRSRLYRLYIFKR